MSVLDLFPLYKLHLVDERIAEIKKRAAALDPGREVQAEIKELEIELAERHAAASSLSGELNDLDLKQKSIDEKSKRLSNQLYGGSIVNPKEVLAIEKELKSLKETRSAADDRILELWESVPTAKLAEQEAATKVADAKKRLQAHLGEAHKLKALLEADYKAAQEQRPKLSAIVDPGVLKRYVEIRDRAGGIGMATVTGQGTCARCGTQLPTKTIEAAKEGKWTQCESCHRILFQPEIE